MTQNNHNNHTSNRGDAQLHQLLFWSSVASFVTVIVYGVAGAIVAQPQMLILSAGAAVLLIMLLLAIRLNRRAQTATAVYLTFGAIAVYALLVQKGLITKDPKRTKGKQHKAHVLRVPWRPSWLLGSIFLQ